MNVELKNELKEMQKLLYALKEQLSSQEAVMKTQKDMIFNLQARPRPTVTYRPEPPPHFYGDKRGPSAREWLFQIQQYLQMMEKAPHIVQFATTYFRGPAATWWYNKVYNATEAEKVTWENWETFCVLVKAEFEPVNPVRIARRRLDGVKQRFSVQQYVREFREITQQIPGITAEELLHRFISGLKEVVQREVDKAEPINLEQAIRMAEKVDYYEMKTKSRNEAIRVEKSGVVPMELGNVMENKNNNIGRKKDMLRKQGACFKCERLGHRAKECKAAVKTQVKERL